MSDWLEKTNSQTRNLDNEGFGVSEQKREFHATMTLHLSAAASKKKSSEIGLAPKVLFNYTENPSPEALAHSTR